MRAVLEQDDKIFDGKRKLESDDEANESDSEVGEGEELLPRQLNANKPLPKQQKKGDEYDKMKVGEMREQCKSRLLKHSGNAPELAARLRNPLHSDAARPYVRKA